MMSSSGDNLPRLDNFDMPLSSGNQISNDHIIVSNKSERSSQNIVDLTGRDQGVETGGREMLLSLRSHRIEKSQRKGGSRGGVTGAACIIIGAGVGSIGGPLGTLLGTIVGGTVALFCPSSGRKIGQKRAEHRASKLKVNSRITPEEAKLLVEKFKPGGKALTTLLAKYGLSGKELSIAKNKQFFEELMKFVIDARSFDSQGLTVKKLQQDLLDVAVHFPSIAHLQSVPDNQRKAFFNQLATAIANGSRLNSVLMRNAKQLHPKDFDPDKRDHADKGFGNDLIQSQQSKKVNIDSDDFGSHENIKINDDNVIVPNKEDSPSNEPKKDDDPDFINLSEYTDEAMKLSNKQVIVQDKKDSSSN
ncbi:MAG: hypothetical protein MI861_07505, partial [Pirellulales bacterium]|nr:hypothetical protein [Pirellulales bacterium]